MRCKRLGVVPLAPDSPAWAASERVSLEMMATPLVMQPTEYIQTSWTDKPYGRITPLEIAALHDGTTLAVRIAWTAVGGDNPDFPDAVALAIPVRGEPPLMTMGTPDEPFHILYWRATRDGKNVLKSIVAQGIGSSAAGPALRGEVAVRHEDKRFELVMTRPIGRVAGGATVLPGRSVKIGFAVWDGGNEERAGIKAFSMDWADLALDA